MAERLRQATVEGRLTADELEGRLDVLYSARTYGELDVLVADLPVTDPPGQPRASIPRWAGAAAAVTLVLAIVSVLIRVARHSAAVAAVPRHPGQFRFPVFPGPFPAAQHRFVAAAPVVVMVAVLVVCAAVLLWLSIRPRTATGA